MGAIVVLAAAALGAGCSAPPRDDGAACAHPCASGYRCVQGSCRPIAAPVADLGVDAPAEPDLSIPDPGNPATPPALPDGGPVPPDDGGEPPPACPPGACGCAGPRPFRSSTPIPQTSPGSAALVSRVYTLPMRLPSDATTVTVRGANRSFRAAAGANAVADVALYRSDGAEGPAGASLGDDSLTLPGDGSFGATAALPVRRGPDGKVVLLYDFLEPVYVYSANTTLGSYVSGTSVDPPPPSWAGSNPNPNYWFTFDYRTTRRPFVVLGDSIAVGYSTRAPVGFSNAAWNQLAAANDYAVDIQGVVQFGSIMGYADTTHLPYLWDQVADLVPGVDVVLQLGTNDLVYNALPAMQSSLTSLVAHLRDLGAGRLWIWTVPPQAGYPSANAVRQSYNSWLQANYASLGLDGVFDAAAPMSAGGLADESDPNLLAAALDSGDQTHPSIAGQTAIMHGWAALVAGAPPTCSAPRRSLRR